MNCFNHGEISAIGICKHCQKGICVECATDLGHGLACRNKHEADVEFLAGLINDSKQTVQLRSKSLTLSNISWLIMGTIFLLFGFYSRNSFLIVFGGFCVAYWTYLFIYNKAVLKKLDSNHAGTEKSL